MTRKERINPPAPSSIGEKEISLVWFVEQLLRYWKWFLLSVVLFLLAGYLYLRYATYAYHVGATIVLKDSKRGGMANSELSVFEGMGLISSDNNIDNEMEMLQSRNLIESVVKELGLTTRYRIKGKMKDTELYGDRNPKFYSETPVIVYCDPEKQGSVPVGLQFTVSKEDNKIKVSGTAAGKTFTEEFASLPALLSTPAGELLLQPSGVNTLLDDYPVEISFVPPLQVAQFYQGCVNIEATGKNTSVIKIGVRETHRQRGEDFLSKLIEVYNRDAMEDKNKAARNAARFMEERLSYINEDLQNAEIEIEGYKRSNRLTDIELESQLFLGEDNEFEKRQAQVGTQLELIGMLEKAIEGEDLLAANLGFADPNLPAMISRYNSALAEKQRLEEYTFPDNPLVTKQTFRINALKTEISAQIAGIRQTLKTKEKELRRESRRYDEYLGDIPRREREYREMTRQQVIKSELYVMLLQKKEEAELSLAVTAPSAQVIESPLSGGPVSPRSSFIYAFCLLLGAIVPFACLGLREALSYKIEKESDVRHLTNVPLIATLPQGKNRTPVVVNAHSMTPIVERFRLLRTNLQFSMSDSQKKVILVTSTVSGEGKTFVSINLALTFALKYKTLLVGLDIRRPKLAEAFGLAESGKAPQGVVSYLTGANRNLNELIHCDVKGSSLDVLLSGSVPPDPNELLMEKTIEELFDELRMRYDYIILDTSPVGSVSDTFLLDRVSDISLYVVRANYSAKACFDLINEIDHDRRLKDMYVVFNCIGGKQDKRYGYGYGYERIKN